MAYTVLELTNLGRRIEHARYDSATLPTPVSADIIREWLCEARTLARTGSSSTPNNELFVVWGILLGNLMQMIDYEAKPGDSEHLAEFLHVASRLTSNALMQLKSKFRAVDDSTPDNSTPYLPVYESLSFVTSNLREPAGLAMLVQALEEKLWEPSALLVLLTQSLDAQRAYAAIPPRNSSATLKKSLAVTALGELLQALQKTWTVSNWRPSQMPGAERTAYNYLWEMYPSIDWQSNRATEALAKMFSVTLAEFPEHGLLALTFVREKNRTEEVILEAILPIRFELLDSKKSIAAVARLLDFNARLDTTASMGLFPEMFAEFHPELNGLIQMHYAMYPISADGSAIVETDYLIGAWDAICKNTPQAIPDPDIEYEVLGNLGSDEGP